MKLLKCNSKEIDIHVFEHKDTEYHRYETDDKVLWFDKTTGKLIQLQGELFDELEELFFHRYNNPDGILEYKQQY